VITDGRRNWKMGETLQRDGLNTPIY